MEGSFRVYNQVSFAISKAYAFHLRDLEVMGLETIGMVHINSKRMKYIVLITKRVMSINCMKNIARITKIENVLENLQVSFICEPYSYFNKI